MSPVKPMSDQKATSPSPAVQHNIDQSWNQQNQDNTDPKKVLDDKFTRNPVDPSKM